MRRSAICYTIGDMEDGIVLGQFLKAKGFSHRLAVRIKAAQGLAVDGIAAYAGYRLKTGQTVEVTLPEEEDKSEQVRRRPHMRPLPTNTRRPPFLYSR